MNDFEYDVFLSHASGDKEAVRELAQRLKGDGLRVWLDEWVIQPGDSTAGTIEHGLESLPSLVAGLSQAAFDSKMGHAGTTHRTLPRPRQPAKMIHPATIRRL